MNKNDFPFLFIGNNIAVDFINTEIVSHGQLVDLLEGSADLVRWAQDANLNIDRALTQTDLTKVLEFRASLKELYTAKISNFPVSRKALAIVNQHLAEHSTRQVLQCKNNEYFLQPLPGALSVPMLLAYLAYEGATLLASPQVQRLKRCMNPDCVLIFLDTSRSQKRRWCSMEVCGNRAKVSKHYRKKSRGEG